MNPEHEHSVPLQEKAAIPVSPEDTNIEDVVEQASAVIEHRKEELTQTVLGLPENTPEEKLEKQNFLHQIESAARQAATQLRTIGLFGTLFLSVLSASPASAEETTWGAATQETASLVSVVEGQENAPVSEDGVLVVKQVSEAVSVTVGMIKNQVKQEAEDIARDAAQTISGHDENGKEISRVDPALDLVERLPFDVGSVPVSGGIGIVQDIREHKERGLLPIVVRIGEIYLTVQTGGWWGVMSGLAASYFGDKILERHDRKISEETLPYVDSLIQNIYPPNDQHWKVVGAQPAQEFLTNEKFFSDEHIVMNLDFSPTFTKEAYVPLDTAAETKAVRILLEDMAKEANETPKPDESVHEYLHRLAQIIVVSGKALPGEPELKN